MTGGALPGQERLRFCFGPSGAGKSTALYREAIGESALHPERNYLILVPDQFTMQVQRDVVRLHPRHAISNIDVLSFSRLRYRVFDEVGGPTEPVLDDMGKTLVLRHVAEEIGGELRVMRRQLSLPGFLDEVKSLLSEFLQYRVSPEDLGLLIGACGLRGELAARLGDLRRIYRGFEDYIAGHFLTAEETMGVLARRIPASSLLAGAEVILDGFTGFTPIQYQVLASILGTARRMTVSLLMDPEEEPYGDGADPGSIFSLTRRTVARLEELAFRAFSSDGSGEDLSFFCSQRRKIAGDIFIRERPVARLRENPALAFLERGLSRGGGETFRGPVEGVAAAVRSTTEAPRIPERPGLDPQHLRAGLAASASPVTEPLRAICLWEAQGPAEECAACCRGILQRLRGDESLRYEDVAVLTTDPETYGPLLEKTAARFRIPIYLDETRAPGRNPLVECMESALEILSDNYAPVPVFRFLRCGLVDLDMERVDHLQLYVEALGIRGRRRWRERFLRTVRSERSLEEQARILQELNEIRERLVELLSPLEEAAGRDVRSFSEALLALFDSLGAREKLREMADLRMAAGDDRGRRTCEQIYPRVEELIGQMSSLLGEQRVSAREYGELLQVGLDKIQIGMIPPTVDRVVVGDMERTRLGEKKLLFVLGANDGLLPRASGGGGLLNEMDRQFLAAAGTGVELAPSAAQNLMDEREYLYMNLTKPSRGLWISWSLVGMDGRGRRPADLIRRLRAMFPGLAVERDAGAGWAEGILTAENGRAMAAAGLRRYADARMEDREETGYRTLVGAVSEASPESAAWLRRLADAAFYRYRPARLRAETAAALYGESLECSASRLERFAGCAFAHFADYGLRLKPQERFEVDAADLGTVYHAALEALDRGLRASGRTLRDLRPEEARALVEQALADQASGYRNQILLDNARYRYMLRRVDKILVRTAENLRYQLNKGDFLPAFSEWDFAEREEGLLLRGRVDRIDLCEDGGERFFRVIDYKSGSRTFDPTLFYHGIQIQLMLYLRAVRRAEREGRGAPAVPAGVFYYRVDDPILSEGGDKAPEERERLLRKKLALSGLANSDLRALSLMDRDLALGGGVTSDILPVGLKKDGSFTAASRVLSTEGFGAVDRFVGEIIQSLGRRILGGEVAVRPWRFGGRTGCDYCPYRGICGFDRQIRGYEMRELEEISTEELARRVGEEGA